MSSAAARAATAAVRAAASRAEDDPARPAFHFRPPAGWMNDPAGMLWRGERCHLFYQHNPYGDRWGDVHWGHAVSDDLVRWRHRPVALAPCREQGEGHCFTGCAWMRSDGTPMLFYTSVPTAEGLRPNEQWAVRCDPEMTVFRRVDDNPVLALADHGGPAFRGDWRDPFVFGRAGRVFLLLGAVLDEDGSPAIPLYEAADAGLLRWEFRGLLQRSDPAERAFFECPNLLSVAGDDLLVVSSHRPVEYVTGRFRPDPGAGGPLFEAAGRGRMDHAAAFYAAGRVATAPGEWPVLVGWVRGWSPGRGWNGTLSLPRLVARSPDGSLRQAPVPAVATLRSGPGARLRDVGLAGASGGRGAAAAGAGTASDRARLDGFRARCLEVRATLAPGSASACGLRLLRARDGRPVATVRLRTSAPSGDTLEIEGRSWGLRAGPGRPPRTSDEPPETRISSIPVPRPGDGRLDLRLFWDRSLLEMFARDGREVCTRVMATSGEPVVVEAFAEGGSARLVDLEAWEMEEIW